MTIEVTPSGQACGATIRGVDLTRPLSETEVRQLREIWLEHLVVAFPDQLMDDDDLERYSLNFGAFGADPFIAPIQGREHVIAVCRRADEKAPLFAENWHSDWSFQESPPAATCLFGKIIPPVGGDTLFANQHLAWEMMPRDLRRKVEGKVAIHSAAGAYAPDGFYGERDKATDRSMTIIPSDEAREVFRHPLVRPHPETGRIGVFSCLGYIVGIEGMAPEAARELLTELYAWQSKDEVVYRHKWAPNMLVMWDNRAVLHCATGGYEGHERLLHRTTIASQAEIA